MKVLLIVFSLVLLLTACSGREGKLAQHITGTWHRDESDTITFAPGGSFSRLLRKAGHTDSFTGTWQIKDRVLLMTITSASDARSGPLIGGVESWNIVRVDDHHLVYEQSRQTNTLSR